MKKITTLDRTSLRLLSDAVMKAVQPVAEEYGLAIKQGRGVFGGTTGKLTIEFATVGEGGVANTRERADFEQYAELVGLKREMLDRSFTDRGRVFTVVGLKLSSRKYPVLVRSDDGTVYKYPTETIARLIKL